MDQKKRGHRAKRSGTKGLYLALGLCIVSAATVGLSLFDLGGEEQPQQQEDPQQKEEAGTDRQQVMGSVPVVVDPQSPAEEDGPEMDPPVSDETQELSQPAQETPQPPQELPVEELGRRMEVVSPLQGEAVAVFSMDKLQYNETTGDWRTHDGVDIAAPAGTAVSAACAGTVISVREDDLMGYTVTVEHGNGYRSSYASLQPEIRVEEGDYVSAGEVLGAVGNSSLIESGQGAHLHFAVTKDGEAMDPKEFLALGK